MTQFVMPVVEYASVKGVALASGPDFVMNDRQLAIAMVRSILTVNSGKASRKYVAAIVRPTLQFMLDWSRAPDLQISSAFLEVVRDFSVTGRIGELAQGVCFAYWKWARGYSWITDFGPWATSLTPPYSGKKSPDFVMLNLIAGDVALMEAKGTRSEKYKPPMGAALRQCRAALGKVLASRGFGSILVLDSKATKGRGTLHIRDPEGVAEITDEMKHYLFRRSYASWFDMVGDDGRAKECRQMPNIEGELMKSIMPVERARRTRPSPLRAITAEALGFA